MAGVYKRPTDKARGRDGKFTCWWIDAAGKKRSKVGTTDRKESEGIARDMEYRARQVKLGLVDPVEDYLRTEAVRPIDEHLEDYRRDLIAKEDTPKHIANTISAIRRLFASVSIGLVSDMKPDRVRSGLGKLKAKGRSARTCNHALRAIKGFAGWLASTGRVKEYSAGIRGIEPFPEKSDRRRVRRALSAEELARLLATTEASDPATTRWTGRHGTPLDSMTGSERAMAYRVAMATGFRAEEVHTLKRERFQLEGDEPTITVLAGFSKRGKRSGRDDVQPIRRDDAAIFKAWLADKSDGVILFRFNPDRTCRILGDDCRAAGIEPTDEKGRVIDFHSLRYSYVTNLIRSGVNPKLVQKLARHSSITLTLDTYTDLGDDEMREAIER